MTQEEKFEEAKRLYETANTDQRYVLESLFPELAESEDERIRKMLIEFFSKGAEYNSSTNGISDKDIVAWLERQAQKPAAWSEEDKRKIDRIYSILRQASDTHAFSTLCRLIGDKECIELQDFLKSLIPQSQWKPSDEQMDALLVKIPIENSCNKVDNILKSLYSDLKKLK